MLSHLTLAAESGLRLASPYKGTIEQIELTDSRPKGFIAEYEGPIGQLQWSASTPVFPRRRAGLLVPPRSFEAQCHPSARWRNFDNARMSATRLLRGLVVQRLDHLSHQLGLAFVALGIRRRNVLNEAPGDSLAFQSVGNQFGRTHVAVQGFFYHPVSNEAQLGFPAAAVGLEQATRSMAVKSWPPF